MTGMGPLLPSQRESTIAEGGREAVLEKCADRRSALAFISNPNYIR
jgi:hypothetical protein